VSKCLVSCGKSAKLLEAYFGVLGRLINRYSRSACPQLVLSQGELDLFNVIGNLLSQEPPCFARLDSGATEGSY